jgi:hypothetical protein
MKYRYVDLESVQIQLCEPPKLDCPQRRFLDTRGEGVFHIGFEADLDTAISQAQESGLDLIMSGHRENGTGFAYFGNGSSSTRARITARTNDCCPTCRHSPASSIALAADTRIAPWHSSRQPRIRRYRQSVLREWSRGDLVSRICGKLHTAPARGN